jgi:hypothetical protein
MTVEGRATKLTLLQDILKLTYSGDITARSSQLPHN